MIGSRIPSSPKRISYNSLKVAACKGNSAGIPFAAECGLDVFLSSRHGFSFGTPFSRLALQFQIYHSAPIVIILPLKRRTKNEPRLAAPSCHGRRYALLNNQTD